MNVIMRFYKLFGNIVSDNDQVTRHISDASNTITAEERNLAYRQKILTKVYPKIFNTKLNETIKSQTKGTAHTQSM